MCTVSAIPLAGGFRLVCNRDELLTRPRALPPQARRFGAREGLMPVDPQSDGTWIAVNDAGAAMAILNVNARSFPDAHGDRCSRGQVIPALLHCEDVGQVLEAAQELDPLQFPPFRLVVLDGRRTGEICFDGWGMKVSSLPFDGAPLMWTSSGLGDSLVEHPRHALFDAMVRAANLSSQRQDAFHQHQWPDRPHLSVMMSRADARTVSQTVIDMTQVEARLIYTANGGRYLSRLRLHELRTV
jgi:hypothetical protein